MGTLGSHPFYMNTSSCHSLRRANDDPAPPPLHFCIRGFDSYILLIVVCLYLQKLHDIESADPVASSLSTVGMLNVVVLD